MSNDESKYRLLGHEDEESDTASVQATADRHHQSPSVLGRMVNSRGRWLWCLAALVVLMIYSSAIFYWGLVSGSEKTATWASPYLNLTYNQPNTIWWNTNFSNASHEATDSEIDELWDTQMPWERGIIAIRHDEAHAMGLPQSQPWPWDGKNKGIYIMNAHHLLHCVRILYISIQQFRRGSPQTITYAHILHCVDALRVEVMCHADDTLRYIPINGDPPDGRYPGDGQTRTCRDWSVVTAFVEAHDPCYRFENPTDDDYPNLERFKFCPEGSEYLPLIRQYFGYSDDWMWTEREGPRELNW